MIYGTFVKPGNETVDYNTRFSRMVEDDLVDMSFILQDVQPILLNMVRAKIAFIRHNLERPTGFECHP